MKKNNPFAVGWFLLFALLPFGNTSLGIITLFSISIHRWLRYREPLAPSKNPTSIAIAIFMLWMIISNISAVRLDIAFLATIGFAVMIYSTFFGTERLSRKPALLYNWLFPLLVLSGFASSLYTMGTYLFGGLSRARAPFTATNGTGTLLIITLLVTMGYFLCCQSAKMRYLLVIPILSNTTALAFTFSRGGWIGAFIAILFLVLLQKKSRLPLLVLLIIVGLSFHFHPALNARFYRIFNIEANQDRIYIWKVSLEMIKANLLTGVGTGMFPFEYPNFSPDPNASIPAFAHNMVLQVIAEFGIPGLAIFTFVIMSVFLQGIKGISEKDPLYQSLMAAFLGVLVHQMVDCTIYGLEIGGAFWLISGLILYLPGKSHAPGEVTIH